MSILASAGALASQAGSFLASAGSKALSAFGSYASNALSYLGTSQGIGGAISFGGDLISGLTARSNMKKYMAFQAAEAQKQRDWAERMSNTAHQREVADLREAGLNPVLSASGGSGAAVPGSAAASISGPGNEAEYYSRAGIQTASAIAQLAQAKATLTQANSNALLNSALASKAHADAGLAVTKSIIDKKRYEYEARETDAKVGLWDWMKDNLTQTVSPQTWNTIINHWSRGNPDFVEPTPSAVMEQRRFFNNERLKYQNDMR